MSSGPTTEKYCLGAVRLCVSGTHFSDVFGFRLVLLFFFYRQSDFDVREKGSFVFFFSVVFFSFFSVLLLLLLSDSGWGRPTADLETDIFQGVRKLACVLENKVPSAEIP